MPASPSSRAVTAEWEKASLGTEHQGLGEMDGVRGHSQADHIPGSTSKSVASS